MKVSVILCIIFNKNRNLFDIYMLTLEEFYKNYENNNIYEANGEPFDVNYNDSGITKVIKKFLNWFLGSTEKDFYDPYNVNWNSDGTKAKLKELKLDGKKLDISFKEIATADEFKAAVNKANCFLNLKKVFDDKTAVKKLKNYKFAGVHCTVEDICDDLPIIYLAYKYEKANINIALIESIEAYSEYLQMKDFISKLKSFLKKQMIKDNFEAKTYSLKVIRLSEKAGWSFENLLQHMAQDKSFTRDTDNETDKSLERIYMSKI